MADKPLKAQEIVDAIHTVDAMLNYSLKAYATAFKSSTELTQDTAFLAMMNLPNITPYSRPPEKYDSALVMQFMRQTGDSANNIKETHKNIGEDLDTMTQNGILKASMTEIRKQSKKVYNRTQNGHRIMNKAMTLEV